MIKLICKYLTYNYSKWDLNEVKKANKFYIRILRKLLATWIYRIYYKELFLCWCQGW